MGAKFVPAGQVDDAAVQAVDDVGQAVDLHAFPVYVFLVHDETHHPFCDQ